MFHFSQKVQFVMSAHYKMNTAFLCGEYNEIIQEKSSQKVIFEEYFEIAEVTVRSNIQIWFILQKRFQCFFSFL